MAEPIMENPLAAASSPRVQLTKVVQDLQDCIAELKKDYSENQIPINDDFQVLHRFCAKLEYLLQAGQKVRTGLLGGKKDYWNYFCDCLSKTKGLNDGIRFVKGISELKTNLGKGRAFIRFGLMHQRLADSLQQCVMNGRVTSDWYHPKSLWMQHQLHSGLINSLYDLNEVQFDLAPRGYDLDIAWPTFARKTFGAGYGQGWAAPSRTSSMSSLLSIPTQDSPMMHSQPLTPSTPTDTEIERLRRDLAISENVRTDLKERLDESEKDNDTMHTITMETESQVQVMRQQQIEMEGRCKTMKREMELKEEAWKEKEDHHEYKLQQSQNALADLNDEINALRLDHMEKTKTQQERESKLDKQVLDLENEKSDLLGQVKNLSDQYEAKTEAMCKASELREKLEGKIAVLEEKNIELLNRIEGFVNEKDNDAANQMDSAGRVHEVLTKLTLAEQSNIDLKGEIVTLKRNLERSEEEAKRKESDLLQRLSVVEEDNEKLRKNLENLEIESRKKEEELSQEKLTLEELTSALQNDLEKSNLENQDYDRKLEHSLQTLKSKSEEIEALKTDLSEVTKKLEVITNDKNTKEKELNDTIKESENINLEIKQQMKILTEELRQRESSVERGQAEHVTQIDSLELKCSELHKENESLESELKESKILANEITLSVETYKDEGVKTKKLCDELNATILEKDSKLTHLEQDLLSLDKTVGQLKDGKLKLEKEDIPESTKYICEKLLSIHSDRELTQSKLRKSEGKIMELQIKNQSLEKQATETSAQLTNAQLQLADLKTLLSQLENSEVGLASKLEEKQLEIDKVRTELIQQSSTGGQLQNQLETSKKELANQEKAMDDLRETNKELENNFEASRKACDSVSAEKAQLQAQVEKFSSNLGQLTSELEKIQQQAVDLRSENAELHRSKQEVLTAHEQSQKETEKLKVEMAEMEESFTKSVEDRLTSLMDKLKTEREGREKLESYVTELRDQHAEHVALLDTMQENKESREAEQKTMSLAMQSKIDELNMELGRLHGQISTTEENHGKVMLMYENLQTQHCDLSKERELLLSNDVTGKSEREQLLSEMTCVRNKLEEASREVLTLRGQLVGKENMLEETRQQVCELQKAKQEIESKMEATQRNLESFKEKCENLAVEKAELLENSNSTANEWREKLDEKKKEIVVLNEKLIAMETAVDSHKGNLRSVEEEKAATEKEKTVMQDQLRDMISDLANTKEKLNNRDSEGMETKRMLEQEISALKFQLSSEQLQYETALKGYATQHAAIESLTEQLGLQEDLISRLEEELASIRDERNVEKERTREELEQLRQALVVREEECRIISGDLKRTSGLLDEERNLVLKFKNDAHGLRQEKDDIKKQISQEMDHLKTDNEQLKKAVIKLIKEKDNLWQKTDQLAYQQKLTADARWMENSEVDKCMSCRKEFSFLVRKHHCRMCGRIFCYNCSNNWIHTPSSNKMERCCDECQSLQSACSSLNSSMIGTEEIDDITVELPHKRSQTWHTTETTEENEDDDNDDDDDDDDDDEEPLSSVSAAAEATEGSTSPPPSDDLDESTGVKSLNACHKDCERSLEPSRPATSGETFDDPTVDCEESIYSTSTRLDPDKEGATASDREQDSSEKDVEEMFDVISPEEVLQSMHDPDPMESSFLLSVEEIEEGKGSNEDYELWVGYGKSYQVPVVIEAPGVVLCWQFSTTPKGISFSVSYREDAMLSDIKEPVILIPTTRCNSHKQSIQGELTARQAGVYTLIFDNTSSRLTSKKLTYRLEVKKPQQANVQAGDVKMGNNSDGENAASNSENQVEPTSELAEDVKT